MYSRMYIHIDDPSLCFKCSLPQR